MLPDIYNAVNNQAQIVLDGGIQRGTDVVKALALGADAVAIGRLQGWGMAANGHEGVITVLQILQQEIEIALKLLGVTSLDQLNPKLVCPAASTTLPHEMSSWVNMPQNRIK